MLCFLKVIKLLIKGSDTALTTYSLWSAAVNLLCIISLLWMQTQHFLQLFHSLCQQRLRKVKKNKKPAAHLGLTCTTLYVLHQRQWLLRMFIMTWKVSTVHPFSQRRGFFPGLFKNQFQSQFCGHISLTYIGCFYCHMSDRTGICLLGCFLLSFASTADIYQILDYC